MSFIELVELISRTTGVPKKQVRDVLYSFVAAITSTVLVDEEEVKINGLGKFYRKYFAPKMTFGKMSDHKAIVGFKSYAKLRNPKERFMEKRAVVLDDSVAVNDNLMVKVGTHKEKCPKCGAVLDSDPGDPPHCPNCGTEPFEKKVG